MRLVPFMIMAPPSFPSLPCEPYCLWSSASSCRDARNDSRTTRTESHRRNLERRAAEQPSREDRQQRRDRSLARCMRVDARVKAPARDERRTIANILARRAARVNREMMCRYADVDFRAMIDISIRLPQRGAARRGLGVLARRARIPRVRRASVSRRTEGASHDCATRSQIVAQGDSSAALPVRPRSGENTRRTLSKSPPPTSACRVMRSECAMFRSQVKREVYASYGVRTHKPGEYEIDHLISLCSSADPIRYGISGRSPSAPSPWNARVKDALEDELHRRVCAGTIDLAKAQRIIAQNWVMGYRIYVNPNPPTVHVPVRARALASRHAAATAAASPGARSMTAPRMRRNQKLTPVIKGRSIAQIGWEGATAHLHFDDGSVMRIHTTRAAAEDNAPPATLGKVRAVRQSTRGDRLRSRVRIDAADPARRGDVVRDAARCEGRARVRGLATSCRRPLRDFRTIAER